MTIKTAHAAPHHVYSNMLKCHRPGESNYPAEVVDFIWNRCEEELPTQGSGLLTEKVLDVIEMLESVPNQGNLSVQGFHHPTLGKVNVMVTYWNQCNTGDFQQALECPTFIVEWWGAHGNTKQVIVGDC